MRQRDPVLHVPGSTGRMPRGRDANGEIARPHGRFLRPASRRSRRWPTCSPRSEDRASEHMTRASPPNAGGGRAQGTGRPAPSTGRGPACHHRTEDRADEVVDLHSRGWRPGKGSAAQMRCSGTGSAASPAGLAPVIQALKPDSAEPADLRSTRIMPARYAASAESAGKLGGSATRPRSATATGPRQGLLAGGAVD